MNEVVRALTALTLLLLSNDVLVVLQQLRRLLLVGRLIRSVELLLRSLLARPVLVPALGPLRDLIALLSKQRSHVALRKLLTLSNATNILVLLLRMRRVDTRLGA